MTYQATYVSASGDKFLFEYTKGDSYATVWCSDYGKDSVVVTLKDVRSSFDSWLRAMMFQEDRAVSISDIVVDTGELFWILACVEAIRHNIEEVERKG